MNGKQFLLLDVIAHILHHLKCQLLTEMKARDRKELKASHFDWVITVPAIWTSSKKKMIREAGYMVSPKLKLELEVYNHMRKSMDSRLAHMHKFVGSLEELAGKSGP